MKNAINNQVSMLGDMFLWLVANLKQGVIYFIKQACGNDKRAGVYMKAVVYCLLNHNLCGCVPENTKLATCESKR